ncbi:MULTISPECIES: hypothetical protein [Pasteurellaceae]|uniref:hypothetical protein n=1 Tax=Pasteurellaceae TaxID=712 RepID=UPI0035639752
MSLNVLNGEQSIANLMLNLGGNLLASCIYDSEGECFRPIIETTAATHCKGYQSKNYPYIAMYQKEFSLGKTNSAQRWKDIVACGGKYED